MGRSQLKNLELFTKICGQKAMENAVLVTTMWSEVLEAVGVKREEELKRSFWKDQVAAGCGIERFEATQESAWRIIGNIVEKNLGMNVRLQEEMGDGGKTVNETEAGICANKAPTKVSKSLFTQFRRWFSRYASRCSCPFRINADSTLVACRVNPQGILYSFPFSACKKMCFGALDQNLDRRQWCQCCINRSFQMFASPCVTLRHGVSGCCVVMSRYGRVVPMQTGH
jgi:hypothetical protein